MFNNVFFRKSYRLSDNVKTIIRAWQATDDNMAHAHCITDTDGYKQNVSHLLLFHGNILARMRLSATLQYIACLVLLTEAYLLPCYAVESGKR